MILDKPVNRRITNYRIGIKTQMTKECLVQLDKADLTLSTPLIGRKVMWKQGKTALAGKIVGFHGRNGMVRVRFTRGLPGQAIGTTVQL